MMLSPNVFDFILATGDSRKVSISRNTDEFGITAFALPPPVAYESLDAAIESLRKASQAFKKG